MKATALACLIGMSLMAANAHADITYKMYRLAKSEGGQHWDAIKFYYLGAGNAFLYANIKVRDDKMPAWFCIPEKFIIDRQNFVDMLDQQIAKRKATLTDDSPLDALLLFGLLETFPCKS